MQKIDFEHLSSYERINVIGTCGSGKTTFGRKLAELLDLPFIELDSLFWKANWQQAPDEELFSLVRKFTEEKRWLLDGNYTRTTHIKWRNVQLVIWLDLPFLQTLYRVIKRCIKRVFDKTELWKDTGNRETFRQAFLSRESIILWAINSYKKNHRKYSRIYNSKEYAHIRFIRLRSAREIKQFLLTIEQQGIIKSGT